MRSNNIQSNLKLHYKTNHTLIRQLGLFDSTMILIGIVIGSGIFLTTGIMAKSIPSPGLILLAWLVGGLMTLAGALTYAELGAAMPEAGGQYIYLKQAFGSLVGFLFGWIVFLVYMTGGIAALAVGFAEYFSRFFPGLGTGKFLFVIPINLFKTSFQYSLSYGQIVAIIVIVLLSMFNYIGLGFGKTIQNIFTIIKIGIVLVFIILGLTIGTGAPGEIFIQPEGFSFSQIVMGFGIALVAVSWAFDGWNNVNFTAGEIKQPERNLPLALILGTLGITMLYLLVNIVYFYALPIQKMIGVVRIAEQATDSLLGGTAAGLVSVAIIISIFGSLNGSILTGPRVYYAMAKDGLFFQRVATIHPRFRTPAFAIVIQCLWSCLFALSGTFEQLITFVMVVSIMFWIAATVSVFTLRKKYPDLPRPYKTWGYPFIPIIFIIASSGILINALIEKPVESLAGVGITLIGIPVHYFWRRKSISEK
jgi:APA family basic amino acid/polyamine antiporter